MNKKQNVIEHLGSVTAWKVITILTIASSIFSLILIFISGNDVSIPRQYTISSAGRFGYKFGYYGLSSILFLAMIICGIIALIKVANKNKSAIKFIKISHCVLGVIYTLMISFALVSANQIFMPFIPILIYFMLAMFYLGYAVYFSHSEKVVQYFTISPYANKKKEHQDKAPIKKLWTILIIALCLSATLFAFLLGLVIKSV